MFFSELLTEKSGHNNGGVGAACLGSGVSAIATKVTTMTESSSIMTSSLPNMELSMNDLDKLSDRLGKFKSPSRLPKPKPEIQPKPAHLVAQLAKHKVPVPVASPTSPTTLEKGELFYLKDHPFKTSAFLRGEGVSPCVDG